MKANKFAFTIAASLLACCFGVVDIDASGDKNNKTPMVWKFISIPDFLNNDVAYPEPSWDQALDYVKINETILTILCAGSNVTIT